MRRKGAEAALRALAAPAQLAGAALGEVLRNVVNLSLIHISEPTRPD